MGAKYTTIAASGYNSSPPADDGSQVAANLITWAGIKAKFGDPVKTEADAINTALVSAFDYSVRQITSSDNSVASDHMRCVEIAPTVTTAVTISLGDATTMTNIYRVFIKNSSARNQTLTRVTGGDTLDGVAGSVVLSPGEGRIVQTNNAANGYVTVSRSGPFTDGDAIVAGGTDGTKKARLEVDGLTTGTTRVITVPDRDFTLDQGLYLLQVNTPSAAATSDFTSVMSSTFDEYILELIDVLPATDGSQLQLQTSTNNGVGFTGGVAYYYAGWQVNDAAGTGTLSATAQALIVINNNAGNGAGRGVNGDIKCWNGTAFRLSTHNNCINNAGNRVDTTLMGSSTDASVNALRLKFSAGNIASGTIRLYGVRKS